ncbi:DUF4227 family protein [Priestia taiwanensis]|uniref:DUF4227 family protein n=1 Tax=Priestia taiwanensis TaxID=1347902 RepID=UPI001662EFEF|nr:DUF4227 family protein [Priestia taiwanensis]MBM7361464.1 hypothetical protein [Priestia taiwanensis]
MKKKRSLLIEGLKVVLLFTGCTILFYISISWIHQEYQNYRRYDEPNQSSIKASTSMDEGVDFVHRMMFFYEKGE